MFEWFLIPLSGMFLFDLTVSVAAYTYGLMLAMILGSHALKIGAQYSALNLPNKWRKVLRLPPENVVKQIEHRLNNITEQDYEGDDEDEAFK